MNGYSVSEAAAVLGVPIERVWELLARGVLAGAPEGETGMRVFLQPRPAAPPIEAVPTPPPNGGAAEPQHELSPFRELLTEFRNLTERYGQALLALGESRGEVAALRSRVDLLEARMDLRLPGSAPAAPWTPPVTDAPAIVAPMPAPAGDDAPPTEHRPPRGPRRATESFAEALARAEDPSPADLPGSDELTDAAARHDAEADAVAEPLLPHELPPAEPVLVADEPEPEPEPEPVAGEPVAPSPQPEPEPEPVEPTFDVERYSSEIDAPDWLEAEAVEEPPAAEDAAPEPVEAAEDPFPGSSDLGAALASLRASASDVPELADAPETPAPASAPAPKIAQAPLPSSALRYRPVASPGGPAGRAYRRLRRIFPE